MNALPHHKLSSQRISDHAILGITGLTLIGAFIVSEGVRIINSFVFVLWVIVPGYIIYEVTRNSHRSLKEYLHGIQLTVLALGVSVFSDLPILLTVLPVFAALVVSADPKVFAVPALASLLLAIVSWQTEDLLWMMFWTGTLCASHYANRIYRNALKHQVTESNDISKMKIVSENHLAFVREMASGKFSVANDFEADDLLGNTLFEMGLKFKASHEGERIRHWKITGLNELGGRLRSAENETSNFREILSFLVKYLNANQGGFFVINKENPDDIFLEMKACYAYEKHKMFQTRRDVGDGLLGQCIAEGELLYLEEIPEKYVHITSGLGLATPSSLIIVPLKFNDEILGALELASFSKFTDHEKEFLTNAGEIIGSAISSLHKTEYATKMLQESQQLTEQLRSQQEEVRQNLEELEATQEHLTREAREREKLQEELKNSKEFLNLVLDSVPIPVFVKDRDHKMVLLNKAVCDLNNMTREQMLGKSDYDFFSKEQADEFWNFEEEIFASRGSAEKVEHAIRQGKETYTLDKKLAIRTEAGEAFLIGINIDVTYAKMAEKMKMAGESS